MKKYGLLGFSLKVKLMRMHSYESAEKYRGLTLQGKEGEGQLTSYGSR